MTAPNKAAPERYGNTRVSKIRTAYNDLRSAVRSGDLVAAQGAFDRYEPWADYVFDKRHSRCTAEYACTEFARPKVKPLVWGAHPVSGLMAEGYQINTDKNKCLYLSFAGIVIEQTEPDAQPEHFETMKELAQDDYERRVLFALGASDDPH